MKAPLAGGGGIRYRPCLKTNIPKAVLVQADRRSQKSPIMIPSGLEERADLFLSDRLSEKRSVKLHECKNVNKSSTAQWSHPFWGVRFIDLTRTVGKRRCRTVWADESPSTGRASLDPGATVAKGEANITLSRINLCRSIEVLRFVIRRSFFGGAFEISVALLGPPHTYRETYLSRGATVRSKKTQKHLIAYETTTGCCHFVRGQFFLYTNFIQTIYHITSTCCDACSGSSLTLP